MPACGYLCEFVNWESAFYVFGAIGIAWFLVWAALVYDSPDTHPRISQKEKEFLQVKVSSVCQYIHLLFSPPWQNLNLKNQETFPGKVY